MQVEKEEQDLSNDEHHHMNNQNTLQVQNLNTINNQYNVEDNINNNTNTIGNLNNKIDLDKDAIPEPKNFLNKAFNCYYNLFVKNQVMKFFAIVFVILSIAAAV